MKTSHVSTAITITTFLFGCGTIDKYKDETAGLMNPPKIHGSFDKESKAYKASFIPINDYYSALDYAKTTYSVDDQGAISKSTGNKEKVKNYINEGIGLVDSYCGRWFHNLDDMSRLLAYQNKNVNIISQLGTTLLGLGGANSYIVTAYGGLNTAYAGASENFNSAFLLAPTASKVKEHIESLMKAEATRMRADADSDQFDFKQAYNRLEKYADLCTHARAKEIVDTALSLTKTDINSTTLLPETIKKP